MQSADKNISMERALTIAGSDSGGGAGIQADLKTFCAFKVYGMSVITAVTAQNTVRVHGVEAIHPKFVSLQIDAVFTDIGVDAVKTGMLFNSEIIMTVARKCEEYKVDHLVVDPVLYSKGGESLLQPDAIQYLKHDLLPLAELVTPNIPEAETLAEMRIESRQDTEEAAHRIYQMGSRAVLVKGGHLKGDAVDILYDGTSYHELSSRRIETLNTHGTGCTYSAAITASLAKGYPLLRAVQIAKSYVTAAIERSIPFGKGHGPLNHYVPAEIET
jgi:hydroxymethylpyrimidine/phosphomethylpyrimidine kinase